MSDGLRTRFQLNATFRNGELVTLPRSNGNARLSFLDSYSDRDKRPNTLSFADGLQSMRTSPCFARVVVTVSPTKLPLTPPLTVRFGSGYSDALLRMARAIGLMRARGIWLPAKVCPVTGSRTVRV